MNTNLELQTPMGSVFSPSETLQESNLSDYSHERLKPLDHLNKLLTSRDVSPVRCVLRSAWVETSERTKREHTRNAPNEEDSLWHALTSSSNLNSERDNENVDESLMKALVDCYSNANTWDTRRQILSYMADKATFSKISQYIPGLTRYRFSSARQHVLKHGRGADVLPISLPKRVVPQDKLSHFLDFIIS